MKPSFLILIKSFFKEYWPNLIFSIALATITQRILFYDLKIESIAFFFFLFLLLSFHKITKYVGIVIAFAICILIPSALQVGTGLCSRDFFNVILTTNNEEVFSYLKSTQTQYILIALICAVILGYFAFKSKINRDKRINIGLIVFSLILLYPFTNRNHLFKMYQEWERAAQLKVPSTPPTWHVMGKLSQKDYQNYIIVLGESLRTDAMSLYGNSYKTTPFLESIPTRLLTNYFASAVNTAMAIPRVLAMTDPSNRGTIHIENNIINIAKESGLDTYWLSAQGFLKTGDQGAALISLYAQNRIYIQDKNDLDMIPQIEKILKSNPNKKLIVAHMYGSHEDPCHHLGEVGIAYKTNHGRFLNCYLSTVKKTDIFFNRLHNILNETGQPYKVVFFSDHGMDFLPDYDGYKPFRTPEIIQTYHVPFFEFGSDITASEKSNIRQSAYNFIKYFPTWIGVKTNMTPTGFDIFKEGENNPDLVVYGEETVKYSSLKEGITFKDLSSKEPQ